MLNFKFKSDRHLFEITNIKTQITNKFQISNPKIQTCLCPILTQSEEGGSNKTILQFNNLT